MLLAWVIWFIGMGFTSGLFAGTGTSKIEECKLLLWCMVGWPLILGFFVRSKIGGIE